MEELSSTGRSGQTVANSRPRAIAIDFDDTLTDGERPSADTLEALAKLRGGGVRVILATGRILSELRSAFADVEDHVDALVAENGAVVVHDGRPTRTAPPIDGRLVASLRAGGTEARQGLVIVATAAAAEHQVLDAVVALGLECQLVHNRSELMVLPSGVNKGTGLAVALDGLALSPHDCVAVGDAENDHSLLARAELGVAVANAVDSLQTDADVVLERPDGAGVIDLLEDVAGANRHWMSRARPTVTVGEDVDHRPVLLPARPQNLIVVGGSGDGKSYLAGLLAEQLITLEYSVLVVDPEGDHIGLGALGSAIVVGADGPPPPVGTVVSLLQRSDACVVLDLSGLRESERRRYLADVPVEVEACRRARGRPHWVFFDEAHDTIGQHEAAIGAFEPAARGYCLITWRPDDLPATVIASTDRVLALTTPQPDDPVVDLVAAVAGQPKEVAVDLLSRPVGHVIVAERSSAGPPTVAALGSRRTPHERHEHKYETHGAELDRSFWFRDGQGRTTGTVARSLRQLEGELAHCPRSVLRHHALARDLSRWIDEVFHERRLAATVRTIEKRIHSASPAAIVDAARLDLISALRSRHER